MLGLLSIPSHHSTTPYLVAVQVHHGLGHISCCVQDGGVVETARREKGACVQCIPQAAAVAVLKHQVDLHLGGVNKQRAVVQG